MRRAIIKNSETEHYIAAINIGTAKTLSPIFWTYFEKRAYQFENKEEAQAAITFIGAVIDWELEEQLEILEVTID